jgi:phage/plasmid primase-like uncharacterized protein
MSSPASEISQRLAREAEAVCRHYLFNGRPEGRYWLVGDIHNTPGRSLYVRLTGVDGARGGAGKWTDAATGEHGDLLDVIQQSCGFSDFNKALEEARRFLLMPRPEPIARTGRPAPAQAPRSTSAARRLFAASRPINGTLAETYLRARGITTIEGLSSLRFHPRCFFRASRDAPVEAWPAMIAAVTDLHGRITGVQRTWLDPSGRDKAPIDTPRRALGQLLGHGVRFGVARDVLWVGEGIETVLSLRTAIPGAPAAAALSAAHLAALEVPPTLRRLYIAQDNDRAGVAAGQQLAHRVRAGGVSVVILEPRLEDFNDDLRRLDTDAIRTNLRAQTMEPNLHFLAGEN